MKVKPDLTVVLFIISIILALVVFFRVPYACAEGPEKFAIVPFAMNAEQGRVQAWKSQPFEVEIRGMSIGDVSGDRDNEIAFIGERDLLVYRMVDGYLEKIMEHKGERYCSFISVDVADINGNGRSEIFITEFRRDSRGLRSFVMEWDGEGLRKIADKGNWYYRVLHIPKCGPVLMGQKRGPFDLFKGGVHELTWINGKYMPKKQLSLPDWINVYGFTYGEVFHDGQEMIVAFTDDDRLLIMDMNGSEKWKSTARYGGSELHLERPSEFLPPEGRQSDRDEMERFYLPQRIHIFDVDNDGKNEIIAVKNKDVAGRLLSRFRLFKSGHIECLTWDALGLAVKQKTQEMPGYISDYAIGDLDNNGSDEILFSLVDKMDSPISRTRSFIMSWGLW